MQDIILQVDWESIRVSPFQPRRVFSENELDELAVSIKEVGLIHPPVVRQIMNKDKVLYYELIAGERRWRAAKKAGLTKLNVIVRDSNEADAAKATLIENLQRVDLDPIETALALKRLVSVFRMTQEEVAEKVGKKRSTVANYLRLLALPQQVQEKISSGGISMGHAKAILSLESPELQEILQNKITEENLTVRQAEKASHQIGIPQKKKKDSSIHLQAIEEKLQEVFGTKVIIDHSSKNGGKVSLHYYNLEDLERLLALLSRNPSAVF